MRRMALRERMPLKGIVDPPLLASQSSPGPGFFANAGSAAIQVMNGKRGSFASALLLMSLVITRAGETLVGGWVSTVSDPDTSWRAAVATASRTIGFGSNSAC